MYICYHTELFRLTADVLDIFIDVAVAVMMQRQRQATGAPHFPGEYLDSISRTTVVSTSIVR